jgi:hypothetical protein
MAADLATLSVRLANTQAIADAKATGAAFEEMGVKGERAALKLVGSSNPVTDAIRKQAVASVEATRGMNAWSAIQAEAAGHVGSHSLAIGRLERNLATVAERALGVNSTVGLMGSSLLKFGIGSIETVGILAGIAAIAAAWEYFTGAARKAREENDKLRESLESGNFQAALGPSPDLVLQTNAQRNTLMQERERRRQLVAFGAKPDDQRIIDLNVEIAHSQSVLEEGERRLFKARMDATTPLEKVVIHARDYTAEMEKQQALLIRYNEMMKQAYGGTFNIMDPRTRGSRASDLENFHLGTMSDAERAALVKQSSIEAPTNVAIPMDAVHQVTATYEVKHLEVMKQLTEAYEYAKGPFKSVTAAVENFQQGLKQAATGLLQQLSPSNIAQGLVNGAVQQVEGWVHNLVGGALTGIRHAVFGQSGEERNAAREAADSARAMALQLDAVTKALGHDQLGAAIVSLQIGLISTLQQINAALPGTKNEAARNAARALATQQESEQERQAREQFARSQQFVGEDLQVRLLAAQGQEKAAAALKLQHDQARERQALIDSFGPEIDATEQTTLALLDQVQAQEKLKAATDAATGSALNMVAGYRLQATIFEAMNPRGASGKIPKQWPGFVSPSGIPGPTPLPSTPGYGDLTVNVVMPDGTVIGKAVLKDFKGRAQKQFGDSTKWSSIQ